MKARFRAALLGCAAIGAALATTAEARTGQRFLAPLFEAAETPAEGGQPASLDMPKYGTWGFDASGMDRSIAPGASATVTFITAALAAPMPAVPGAAP